jgi:hypothetical protein
LLFLLILLSIELHLYIQINHLKTLILRLVTAPVSPGPLPASGHVIPDCGIGSRGFHLGAEPAAPGLSDKFVYLHKDCKAEAVKL